MNVTVNGERRELADGATLADLVVGHGCATDKGSRRRSTARSRRAARGPAVVLRDGQAIELLTAVQGG